MGVVSPRRAIALTSEAEASDEDMTKVEVVFQIDELLTIDLYRRMSLTVEDGVSQAVYVQLYPFLETRLTFFRN